MTREEVDEAVLAQLRRGPFVHEIAIRMSVGGSRTMIAASLRRLEAAGRIERAETRSIAWRLRG